MLKRELEYYNGTIVLLLSLSITERLLLGLVYAPCLGLLFATLIIALKIKLCRKVRREGFSWKRYKVIELTYLTRWHRKPTGFFAVSINEGEPLKRYHFPYTEWTESPGAGDCLDICIPRGVKISVVGVTSYVCDYYGMMNGEHEL